MALLGHKAVNLVSAGVDGLAQALGTHRVTRFNLVKANASKTEFVQRSEYGDYTYIVSDQSMYLDGQDMQCVPGSIL